MRREVRGTRVVVDDGSNPAAAGVRSEFRFGVMLSSMAARDTRRKSSRGSAGAWVCGTGEGTSESDGGEAELWCELWRSGLLGHGVGRWRARCLCS
jgi:hypothetical protein